MYPGRARKHTPYERFRRKRRDTSIYKNDLSPPPAAFVGRMQYAPTLPENLKSKNENESGIRVGAYCIRPTNILSRTILCYTNIRLRRLRQRLEGVCFCVPTIPDNREVKSENKKGIPIISEFQKLDFSPVWYSSLALMQEKNQKKIKASGMPAKFETFRGPNVPGQTSLPSAEGLFLP